MASQVKGYLKAKARFTYGVGNLSSSIEVGGESGLPKSTDDWKVSLALDAVNEVTETHQVKIKEVRLSLVSIEFDSEGSLATFEKPIEHSLSR
ncbi:hypothetical protein HUO09_17090 [Vibrio sp. Y2-5]|uniref:hypothetical protein n=1 Tax=Vibrio sp. Y2-5 TaxID=2743977 RepID=UPI001660C9CB|nr:hypothetical protein [Vibrio sp. Y2-5]MBD0788072.1 hypothetical protein [Vibrio sp. Y2-5]